MWIWAPLVEVSPLAWRESSAAQTLPRGPRAHRRPDRLWPSLTVPTGDGLHPTDVHHLGSAGLTTGGSEVVIGVCCHVLSETEAGVHWGEPTAGELLVGDVAADPVGAEITSALAVHSKAQGVLDSARARSCEPEIV